MQNSYRKIFLAIIIFFKKAFVHYYGHLTFFSNTFTQSTKQTSLAFVKAIKEKAITQILMSNPPKKENKSKFPLPMEEKKTL